MLVSARKRITFLIGSGVSAEAQIPRTGEITKQVLSGESVNCKVSGLFVIGGNTEPDYNINRPWVSACRDCSVIVKDRLEELYKSDANRHVTYEDIADYLAQLYNCKVGERENPAVRLELICFDELTKHLQTANKEEFGRIDCKTLLSRTHDYIYDTVCNLLQKKPATVTSFDLFQQALQSQEWDRVVFATLNHDLVLDDVLASTGNTVADGFGVEVNEIAYWNRRLLARNKNKVPLLKLHGSLDWYSFANEVDGHPRFKELGRTRMRHIGKAIDRHGHALTTMTNGRPIIMVGTFGKEIRYTHELFFDLHWRFREALVNSAILTVVGYSFRDKGINSRLVEALILNKRLKIIIIHPNYTELQEYARPLWQRILRGEEDFKARIDKIEKGIECTGYDELKSVIERVQSKS